LIRAVRALGNSRLVLVLVGAGELDREVRARAAETSSVRVLPFQNQSRMPVVYRMGDLLVLPSAYGETWGLAVNEAMACGRPVLVSERVGCATDLVDPSCGRVFSWNDFSSLERALAELTGDKSKLAGMGRIAAKRAWASDVARTETALLAALEQVTIR
jgi:glycosyltransferase involved in cell wall biosynthesis